mgnify:FL=1
MQLTTPVTAALCFFGGVALCLLVYTAEKLKSAHAARRKRQKGKAPQAGKGLGGMDTTLIILGAFLLCFTITMIVIFIVTGSTPDTLIQCVFGLGGLEGGVMGWIKTTKERRQDRRWARQDAREAERAARAAYQETEN